MEKYLTEEGHQALLKNLKILKEEKRPEIIEAIREARTQSVEITENTEYLEAREQQNIIERKISDLETYLSECRFVDTNTLNIKEKVIFGSIAILLDLDTEEELHYQIVGEMESDIKKNKISYTSPLGRAVTGKEIGDVCDLMKPDGEFRELEILDVKKP